MTVASRDNEAAALDGSFTDFDRAAMTRALELAERGLETTHPNPRVGCVIAQGERIVGEGWHEWPGEAHAEVMALRAAGSQAVDSTVYVTLEPCNHFGRTPPCANALIEARVKRVVFAMRDPNPQVVGGGAEALQRAGTKVESGLMHDEAAELNVGWIKRMRSSRPWVRVKLAMSLDGRTALANGASQWITSEPARADVQLWRARSSAILTGSGTVLADDPQLNVRLPAPRRRQPARVVLDTTLRTPPTAKLFSTDPSNVTIFTASHDPSSRAALEACGARVEQVVESAKSSGPPRNNALDTRNAHIQQAADNARLRGAPVEQAGDHAWLRGERAGDDARLPGEGAQHPGEGGTLDLNAVLDRLGALSINEVLVEAGATLSGALIREGLVDELLVYIAPMLLGPQARALASLPELTDLSASPRFSIIETRTIGPDVRLRLRPLRS